MGNVQQKRNISEEKCIRYLVPMEKGWTNPILEDYGRSLDKGDIEVLL